MLTKLSKRFTLFLLFILTGVSYASTFYVDSIHGSDANNGLTTATAWKTVAKVSGYNLLPGDSVLFKRGCIWREKCYVYVSGTSGNPIYFGAYGEGEKPLISAVDEIPGWNISENWIDLGNNKWQMNYDWNPVRLLIDGEEVLKTNRLDLVDGFDSFWYYNDGALYVYSTGNPAEVFQSMMGNKLYFNVRVRDEKYLVFEDLDFEGGSGNTIAIYGCSYLTIRNCTIGRYGWLGIRLNAYNGLSSHHISIENNLIDSGFHFSYGPPAERGVEDGVLLSGGVHDCVVSFNSVLDWGHCGIYCYALYDGDLGVYDNIICNNLISGKNVSYMHGIGTDGREGLCRDNEFYNNLIQDITVRNQINGNNNRVHHNVIDGVRNSPAKSGATGQGFDLQGYGDGKVCHDNYIDNNTILNCDEAGIRLRADLNDKMNNHFRNNIVYNCGRNSKEQLDHCGIVIDNHHSVKGNIFQNNCIYGSEATEVIYYRGERLTVSEFNEKHGENNDHVSDNIQNNPLFIDENESDYHLDRASPCLDAGLLLGFTLDFYGNPVPVGVTADIGASECQDISSVFNNRNMKVLNYILFQNYPNPFNSETNIRFSLPVSEKVDINIFNIQGELISNLMNGFQKSGVYNILWKANKEPSGIYFCNFQTGEYSKSIKLLFVK